MAKQRNIELLAPARNAACAIEAIVHGADAVYIGAPKFGARSAAGNSLTDIARVVEFAHLYHVKVYVTLNVLIHDEELAEVEKLIHALWRIGIDALIVQDMGITRLNLPPIPLHASTQTNNRTAEKVRFLEEAGFRQIVLARELSLEQIQHIASETTVSLECFVHGALCVSYSGQCYLSHAMCGRSANRGECAQWCRLPYDLEDADGHVLIKKKHLLSLKDLNLTDYLEALIDAGISSFKIEGRLKDVDYVRNITAWYNQQLNQLISRRFDLKRPSLGISRIGFIPDPVKSFNRGFTTYFLQQRSIMSNPDTPKSVGETVGVVNQVFKDHLLIAGNTSLSNGDGLSYFNQSSTFDGFRVNRIEGAAVYPARMPDLKPGTVLYRTSDHSFERLQDKTPAVRVIPVSIECHETSVGFFAVMEDTNGHRAMVHMEQRKQKAQKPQKGLVASELSKLGNSRYEVVTCQLDWSEEWFVPASRWAGLRRQLCDRMDRVLRLAYKRETIPFCQTTHPYPEQEVNYLGNVLNRQSNAFYRNHGTLVTELSPEHNNSVRYSKQTALMTSKYCLRYELGACPKQGIQVRLLKEPLYLVHNEKRFQVSFDCKACEMKLFSTSANQG